MSYGILMSPTIYHGFLLDCNLHDPSLQVARLEVVSADECSHAAPRLVLSLSKREFLTMGLAINEDLPGSLAGIAPLTLDELNSLALELGTPVAGNRLLVPQH